MNRKRCYDQGCKRAVGHHAKLRPMLCFPSSYSLALRTDSETCIYTQTHTHALLYVLPTLIMHCTSHTPTQSSVYLTMTIFALNVLHIHIYSYMYEYMCMCNTFSANIVIVRYTELWVGVCDVQCIISVGSTYSNAWVCVCVYMQVSESVLRARE